MRTIIRLLVVGAGLAILILTFKTDVIPYESETFPIGKTTGYIFGAALIASYLFGKYMAGLALLLSLASLASQFFELFDHFLPVNGYLLSGGFFLLAVLLWWIGDSVTQYWCANCGRSMPDGTTQCPNCGSYHRVTEEID